MFSRILKQISVLAIVAVVAYAFGATHSWRNLRNTKHELADATPPQGLYLTAPAACVAPNERERALIKTAVDVLGFASIEAGFLVIGSQQFLSQGLFRRDGETSVKVCDIPEEYERAAQFVEKMDHFRHGRLVEYQLKLIAKLPHPSERLAKLVAASAFNDNIQLSDTFPNQDIRPLARATLASLGERAQPYADLAFKQISVEDAMGTGAAQVAVAGGHPMALQAVEDAMTDKLSALPKDFVIPRDIRNRLYEMAYALALAGAKAQPHVAPLRDLMGRRVESWAQPFGMIELQPRRMCGVLAAITGPSETTREFGYCADEGAPYEQ